MIIDKIEHSSLIAAFSSFNQRASRNVFAHGLDGLVAGVALAAISALTVYWCAKRKKGDTNIEYVILFALAVVVPPVLGAAVGGTYGFAKTFWS